MAQRIARSALPARGRIIVLNGCSSAGKSSLAKALQALLPQPQLHVQLDMFRDMEPGNYWGESTHAAWPMRLAALCRAMHASTLQYVAHGLDVILDHAPTPDAWHYLVEDFRDQRVWLVGVHCPVDELERREQARGDRPVGLAAQQFTWIHRDLNYDVEVDTSAAAPAMCAEAVAQRLREPRPALGFDRLRERMASS
jgi:chloramphenicol 3-O phosphotransferase